MLIQRFSSVPKYHLELPVKLKSKKRGNRRDRSDAVIRNRLKEAMQINPGDRDWLDAMAEEANRFNKRHPFDCGATRCFTCHADKLSGEKPVYYQRRYGT